jgi:hypothetical protein
MINWAFNANPCIAWDNSSYHVISGPGYSGWYRKASQADQFSFSWTCCDQTHHINGWSGYLEIQLTVQPNATVPSIQSLVGTSPCGGVSVNECSVNKPVVWVQKVSDASDYYYGGTYNGLFRIYRGSSCSGIDSDLTVHFSLTGTAVSPCIGGPDVDYNLQPPALPANCYTSVIIPAGSHFININLVPILDPKQLDPNESVILTITQNAGYCISTEEGAAVMTIFNN